VSPSAFSFNVRRAWTRAVSVARSACSFRFSDDDDDDVSLPFAVTASVSFCRKHTHTHTHQEPPILEVKHQSLKYIYMHLTCIVRLPRNEKRSLRDLFDLSRAISTCFTICVGGVSEVTIVVRASPPPASSDSAQTTSKP
jgi:hypothetical protein